MRKTALSLSFLAIFTFLFISMAFDYSQKKNSSDYIFSKMTQDPVLPFYSFDYEISGIPQHILDDTVPDAYYKIREIDTSLFPLVTNDGATLGRVLFYDKKLSALENMSCASCHKQANSFADDGSFSQGIDSETKRNSLHLNDLAWTSNNGFFWDMRSKDLHEAIGLPLKDKNEIGADIDDVINKLSNEPYYQELFTKAYGSQEVTEYKIVDALSQFIFSMVTFNTEFDVQAPRGFDGYNDEQLEGRDIFRRDCASCHFSGKVKVGNAENGDDPDFILNLFENLFENGLPKSDQDIGIGSWKPTKNGLFKVPTIRNIALTAPYMHDGRFETLEQVIDFYSDDNQDVVFTNFIPKNGFQYGAYDKKCLLEFLHTLTDLSFVRDEKFSDPFDDQLLPDYEPTFSCQVYPNPTSSFATIEILKYTGQTLEISVMDASGKMIFQDQFVSDRYELNKFDFNSGIYFLHIKSPNYTHTQKLIVQ